MKKYIFCLVLFLVVSCAKEEITDSVAHYRMVMKLSESAPLTIDTLHSENKTFIYRIENPKAQPKLPFIYNENKTTGKINAFPIMGRISKENVLHQLTYLGQFTPELAKNNESFLELSLHTMFPFQERNGHSFMLTTLSPSSFIIHTPEKDTIRITKEKEGWDINRFKYEKKKIN